MPGACVVVSSGDAAVSARLRRSRGGGGQLVGLVVDGHGDLTQLVTVLSRVVGAEEQVTTARELDTEVGLCSATVAAVNG